MDRSEISRLSLEIFLSHSTEKFSRGNLRFSENLFNRKILWIGRGYHDFLSKLLPHSTEKIRRRTLLFQKSSGLKKLHKMVYHDFVENLFSHSTEKFRRGTLRFSENLFNRKILWIGRGYHDFLSKLLSHSTEKIPRRTLLFQKCSELKKLHKMVYHDFVGK